MQNVAYGKQAAALCALKWQQDFQLDSLNSWQIKRAAECFSCRANLP